MRILIVEDDADVRDGLYQALTSTGHDVFCAGDYSSAVSAADAANPDVLICDWQLDDPEGDGVDVARDVSENRSVRVVMVTARDLDELKARVGDMPVAAYLRKPIGLINMFAVIDKLQ